MRLAGADVFVGSLRRLLGGLMFFWFHYLMDFTVVVLKMSYL